jgi:hypothetical protein
LGDGLGVAFDSLESSAHPPHPETQRDRISVATWVTWRLRAGIVANR